MLLMYLMYLMHPCCLCSRLLQLGEVLGSSALINALPPVQSVTSAVLALLALDALGALVVDVLILDACRLALLLSNDLGVHNLDFVGHFARSLAICGRVRGTVLKWLGHTKTQPKLAMIRRLARLTMLPALPYGLLHSLYWNCDEVIGRVLLSRLHQQRVHIL